MRTPQEIIHDLKNITYWSQPNMKYEEIMNLLSELEATFSPVEKVVVVETPVVEELVIEEVITEEEITIEDIQTEEPVTETAPVKTTRKK